ncbi:MAG: hypothetical protein ACKV19_25945 [Verrucomicrobiales bacterium]
MRSYLPALVALIAAPFVQSQVLVAGFDGPEYNTDNEAADVAGQNGWAINDATPDISFFVLFGYLDSPAGNHGAAVGGYLDAPVEGRVELSNTYGGSLVDSFTSLKFAVQASTDDFPGRDTFGWTLRDSSNASLMSISLEPSETFNDRLEVVWYDSANTRSSTGHDLFYGNSYDLTINFAQDGAHAGFSALIAGAQTLPFSGTLPGAASATLQTFAATTSLGATQLEHGDNYLVFDNLSIRVIPEPAVGLLALSGLLFGLRRRRCAK